MLLTDVAAFIAFHRRRSLLIADEVIE